MWAIATAGKFHINYRAQNILGCPRLTFTLFIWPADAVSSGMQTWNLINFLLGARVLGCVCVFVCLGNQNETRAQHVKVFSLKNLTDQRNVPSVCSALLFFSTRFSSISMANGQQPQFECNLVSNLKCSCRMKHAKISAHVWLCSVLPFVSGLKSFRICCRLTFTPWYPQIMRSTHPEPNFHCPSANSYS